MVKFRTGSGPAQTHSEYAGAYLLGPDKVNEDNTRYYTGAYYISTNGKYAFWFCKSCTNTSKRRFFLGKTSEIGGDKGVIYTHDLGTSMAQSAFKFKDWFYSKDGVFIQAALNDVSLTSFLYPNSNYSNLLVYLLSRHF